MVSGSVALPCSGFFSPFPHGTGPLSVSYEYLALPDGPGGFTQDSSCPALLRIPKHRRTASHTGLSPSAARRSRTVPLACACVYFGPTTPAARKHAAGLGSSPVARHYWGNHCCFLFLEVLRCFSSLRSPLYLSRDNYPSGNWVVPFGNPRINGHLHLPQAYRSLSRPSSPPRAKASTRRPNLLSPNLHPQQSKL